MVMVYTQIVTGVHQQEAAEVTEAHAGGGSLEVEIILINIRTRCI